MPFIPANNVIMVELRYTHMDSKMENTLYFSMPGEKDLTSLQAVGEAIYGWWADNMAPITSSQCGLREVFVTDLTAADATAVAFVPDTIIFGAQTTDPMPGNVTLAIKFSSPGRGRSSRGRNYIVGAVETQVSGQRFLTSYVDAVVAAYNELFAVASALEIGWVVLSRFHNNAPRAAGVISSVSSVSAVDDAVDSQRRRLLGRGA